MEETIKVIIDEEIFTLFSSAFLKVRGTKITPGVVAYRFTGGTVWYWNTEYGKALFRLSQGDYCQFDNEFTEWLKINRPEVFL